MAMLVRMTLTGVHFCCCLTLLMDAAALVVASVVASVATNAW